MERMPDQSPVAPPKKHPARRNLLYGLLAVCVLVAVNIAVYSQIYRRGLIPPTLYSTPTMQFPSVPAETGMVPANPPTDETSLNAPSETPSPPAPIPETPARTETETPTILKTPFPTTPAPPSPTPEFESCQYTLKAGPQDFLYAIYWNWHINENIPYVQNFYARITCAVLLSNKACAYDSNYPGKVMPGWVLVLPGVSPNICLLHNGTPVP
jgi:hypothetical protein